ncbi:ADP-ribosylglycohydrolase family protein [Leptolyngbya cf. ectocarpi LEGE 11479]|uniref:ADP-ribosylglycohydrolase family protein n=1 Tax=Leptolyngbya cf. ectocarpi LEGE 11479 TaxID=1828722 RepID=A0A928WZ72_LEPEC|nr:ADP-ribosylglycohydrolase family protein [Leptolyngbya ectocarpi]MBE9066099.1 ADP-ribosylglycohydrolase family protein [Leptolyngbya cf. ectocarpi LEGE 11479]
MLGAITGDTIGSAYEFAPQKTKDFPLFTDQSIFTDDTILTVAVADVLLHGGTYTDAFKRYYQLYPDPCGGYGARFQAWAASANSQPYNSWGNGAAMRVSPVAYAHQTLDAVLQAAQQTAVVTHNHPEGIKGAQATAAAIFLARQGQSKPSIKQYIETQFGYDLSRSLDQIRPTYEFNESCQETVPEAIIAFLESTSFTDAVRNAVSLGGDADTLTCITGSIAEAFYGEVPDTIADRVWALLPVPLQTVVVQFQATYPMP